MTRTLDNKVAVITGASKGIGRATASRLAAEGAALAVGSTNAVLLEAVQRDIERTGAPVLAQPCDVSRMGECAAFLEKTLSEFGRVDILINNGGIGYAGDVAESDPEEIERMVNVNLLGVYHMTRAVLPAMISRKSGDIVNIGSVAATKPSPGFAMYSATKFAVRAFSEALRFEVRKHNIRVTAIHPGMTQTAFFDTFTKGGTPPLPLDDGDLLPPGRIADAILFALKQPEGSSLNELVLRPTWQER